MTPDDSHDATCDLLAPLSRLAPDSDRAERTRMRCRARLERNRERSKHTAEMIGLVRRGLASAAIGGFWIFCVIYLGALLVNILRLQG